MPMNNNNPANPFGGSSSMYGNMGMMGSGMQGMPTFGQVQSQFGNGFQNQYQLSVAQEVARAQPLAQGQAQAQARQAYAYAQVQAQAHVQAQAQAHARAQAQAQAAHWQYQAQMQAQGYVGPGGGVANHSFGSASARRIPQKPPLGPQATSVYSTPASMEVAPMARRSLQQSKEKKLEKKLASILPESDLYTQLLEFENRVDATILRKQSDIQEALKNPPCVQKTLRIYIFNTFSNQNQPTPEDPNAESPTWTLRVTGRLLDDEEGPGQPGGIQKSTAIYPKFSSFLKRVTIKLDQQLYPDDHIILWEQARSPAPTDGFEVKRKGDKEFTAKVSLEMKYSPPKFTLSPALKALLGIEADTRSRLIAAIWSYIKSKNLTDRNDLSIFHCDPPLQRLFGEEKLKFTMLSQKISPHLSHPPSINLEHTVKVSGNIPSADACYDVVVDLPFPIVNDLSRMFSQSERAAEIESCDKLIADSLKQMEDHHKRRAFFLGFSQSPSEFINTFIESQSRDLKLPAGEYAGSKASEKVAEFYNQPWVDDAVIRHLNRKPVAGKDARGK